MSAIAPSRCLIVPLFLTLILAHAMGLDARADAVRGWAGASASAGYDAASRDASLRSGPTATASNSWYQRTMYDAGPSYQSAKPLPVNTDDPGPMHGGYAFSVYSSGSSSALADPGADTLLKVAAKSSVGNPGSYHGSIASLPSAATAAWSGDRLTVSAPDGAALPDSIRLQLRLDWDGTAPYRGNYYREKGSVTVTTPDRSIRLTDLWSAQSSFDSVDDGGHTALLHADVKLDQGGVSDLISLQLLAEAMASNGSNTDGYATQTAGLSIVGVDFADGTPLASRGYGVSFDSGLVVPGTVPEPASVVIWGVIALGACGIIRRYA